MVGGVCGGIGESLGVDPLWFRLAFVVLTLGSGSGIVLYLVAWLIIPEHDGATPARPERGGHHPGRGSTLAGLVLIAVGGALLLDVLIPWFDDVVWPLSAIVAGAGLVYVGSRR